MNRWRKNLSRTHLYVLLGLFLAFTILTYMATEFGVDDGPKHARRVWITTASTLSGPLIGAIARELQSCCLRFSLQIMAVCAPLLIACVVALGFGSRERKWVRVTHMTLWILGWTAWFMGGLLSFAHALS